jgi:hypothetical protein
VTKGRFELPPQSASKDTPRKASVFARRLIDEERTHALPRWGTTSSVPGDRLSRRPTRLDGLAAEKIS